MPDDQPRSERFRNYLIGIGAATGLILGLLAQFKGEPVAEQTWNTLRAQVNKQSESINELHIRLEVLQAIQESRAALVLGHELEELQKKYDSLAAERAAGEGGVGSGEPRAAEESACPPGRVRGSDGRCRAVHTSVVSKVKQDEKKAASAHKELKKEKTKRMVAERETDELMRRFMQQDRAEQKPLEALPSSLEEASKN